MVISLPALVLLSCLVHHNVLSDPVLVDMSLNVPDSCVVPDLQPPMMFKRCQVTDQGLFLREELACEMSQQQSWVIAEQGVPVMAHVKLRVGTSGVTLVDADQLTMSRVC